MNDLAILHLSDLHIDGQQEGYSRLLQGLINDIKKEVVYVEERSLIVVVTGDIIHQGNKKATEAAIRFFRDLKNVLASKVVGIYIVPGNHDKFRSSDNKFLVPAYRALLQEKDKNNPIEFDTKFYESFWSFHKETYSTDNGSGYLELTKEIYKIFGLSDDQIQSTSYVNNTYGVDIMEVLGKKYCFVLLNTAWSCIDNYDSRNMVLGAFQLEAIRSEYHRLTDSMNKDKDIGLTIVLGHHPISALHGREEDKLFTEMISFEGLDADVYLCGHTHDRTAINWSNNRHTISTLVTGIGWPEKQGGNHVGDHTYSIYVFNLDANSIDIYVRSTDDGGKFVPDFRIYTTDVQKDSKKIVFPIRSKNAQTYISLNAQNGRSPKAYYLSNEFMIYIQQYLLDVSRFRYLIGVLIETAKNTVYQDIDATIDAPKKEHQIPSEPQDDTQFKYATRKDFSEARKELYSYLFSNVDENDMPTTVQVIFSKPNNKRLLNEMFMGFLEKLCYKMYQVFVSDDREEGELVRFHFRYLSDRRKHIYKRLCLSFQNPKDSKKHDVSDLHYGQLLKAAFESKTSLIYEVNRSACEVGLKEKWSNFITIVPDFDQNYYKPASRGRYRESYPFLTFGVTINTERWNKLLYCMDFFSMKNVIEETVERYVRLFAINIDEFCRWVDTNVAEEAEAK